MDVARVRHFDGLLDPPSKLGEEEIQRLVRGIRLGDSGAASRLYSALVIPVFRAVRPLFSSEADAEDVVQDTFVKAFNSLDSTNHDRAHDSSVANDDRARRCAQTRCPQPAATSSREDRAWNRSERAGRKP